MSDSEQNLGNFSFPVRPFPCLEETFKRLHTSLPKSPKKRFLAINETLADLILQSPEPCFLLAPVLAFIDQVNREKFFDETYRFALFEFWLNTYAHFDWPTKQRIRAKIVGKFIPREAYQTYFPIGMQKEYDGSHFVVAHLSPDIDTTIASFWGWVDAFGAKVGTGQHLWNLPGGAPDSHITMLFRELFGQSIFTYLARPTSTLTLTALDLLTQQGMERQASQISSLDFDHGNNDKAIIHIDDEGHYLGDWRSSDVEPVRQVTNIFKSFLHWFENNFHVELISLFSNEVFHQSDVTPFLSRIFEGKMKEAPPIQELTTQQLDKYTSFLKEIFHIEKGLEGSFWDLSQALVACGLDEAEVFVDKVRGLKNSSIFEATGKVLENRPVLFGQIERIIRVLDEAIQQARAYVERLEVVMLIKEKVLHIPPQYIFLRSDVEEIKTKMRSYDYLTVVVPESKGKYYPAGIVRAIDLQKEFLGSVSFRDFSNFQETKMASYLQIISVIDHHKVDFKTVSAPQVFVSDAQSCNSLVAEKAIKINDLYSSNALSQQEIDQQIDTLSKLKTAQSLRLIQRLIQKRMANDNPYWVAKEREFAEYLCFLHAILDDTDLLSKVSDSDVDVVAMLLNRMKTLSVGHEVEVIDLSDLPRDETYAKKASDRILKNDEMYSIYQKIYEFKEQEVEANILLCSQGLVSNFFADTKEQNGCVQIGQAKMFSSNFPTYLDHARVLKEHFVRQAREKNKNTSEIDLYMHMISTVPSADEVHGNVPKNYAHRDEIWFWISGTQTSQIHLARFLSAFQTAPEVKNNSLDIEYLGENYNWYDFVFSRNFLPIPKKISSEDGLDLAILRFNPGTINSRKSMITPYLPRFIS